MTREVYLSSFAKFTEVALAVSSLACVAGCSGQNNEPVENVGRAIAEIRLAPTNARCAVIRVTLGTTTVVRQFNLAPEGNTVFALDGLPIGNDTFTATAFASAC